MGSDSAASVLVISSSDAETDSTSSSINFNFKREIEQNLNLKAIAENCFVLIPDSKAKVDAVVPNIDRLLSTVDVTRHFIIHNFDLKELDNDCLKIKIIPDDLDSVLLNKTTELIQGEQDRISDWKPSFERRRKSYTFTIMIAVIIMLAVSSGFALARKWLAAVVIIKLAMAIKATETYLNVMLSEEEKMLEEEEKVVKMMRGGKGLMVNKFNNIKQKAKTLKEKFVTEYSKLEGHTQRMEKSEMMETINEIECDLTALKCIIDGYRNEVQKFIDEFTEMVY